MFVPLAWFGIGWLAYKIFGPHEKRITGVRIGPVRINKPEVSGMYPRHYDVAGFSWGDAQALAAKHGPTAIRMIAKYYPPAAAAMAVVDQLQQASKAGDPAAKAKLADIAIRAKNGDPKATALVKAAATLKHARGGGDASEESDDDSSGSYDIDADAADCVEDEDFAEMADTFAGYDIP